MAGVRLGRVRVGLDGCVFRRHFVSLFFTTFQLGIAVGLVVLEHEVRNRHQLAGRGNHGHVVILPFSQPPEEGSDRAGMIRCRLRPACTSMARVCGQPALVMRP